MGVRATVKSLHGSFEHIHLALGDAVIGTHVVFSLPKFARRKGVSQEKHKNFVFKSPDDGSGTCTCFSPTVVEIYTATAFGQCTHTHAHAHAHTHTQILTLSCTHTYAPAHSSAYTPVSPMVSEGCDGLTRSLP